MFIISTYFFLVLIPSATSLTFNFTHFSPKNQNHDIETAGDGAYISNDGIQVTPDGIGSQRSHRTGRATYIKALHLWDKTSGEVVDFTTEFTFVIDSNSAELYADGLTFFLAQTNSVIANGGAMGLPIDANSNVTTNPFVAVEFDTFWNPEWDPIDPYNFSVREHVGIDVNSLVSVRYQPWQSNVTGGRECQACIKYDSVLKKFSVSFTGFEDDTVVWQNGLYYIIDMRDVLPEWVIFGFSAATGDLFQKHNVKSWAFNSSDLQIDETKGKTRKRSAVGLIAGLCVLVTLMAMAILLFLFVWRKKMLGI